MNIKSKNKVLPVLALISGIMIAISGFDMAFAARGRKRADEQKNSQDVTSKRTRVRKNSKDANSAGKRNRQTLTQKKSQSTVPTVTLPEQSSLSSAVATMERTTSLQPLKTIPQSLFMSPCIPTQASAFPPSAAASGASSMPSQSLTPVTCFVPFSSPFSVIPNVPVLKGIDFSSVAASAMPNQNMTTSTPFVPISPSLFKVPNAPAQKVSFSSSAAASAMPNQSVAPSTPFSPVSPSLFKVPNVPAQKVSSSSSAAASAMPNQSVAPSTPFASVSPLLFEVPNPPARKAAATSSFAVAATPTLAQPVSANAPSADTHPKLVFPKKISLPIGKTNESVNYLARDAEFAKFSRDFNSAINEFSAILSQKEVKPEQKPWVNAFINSGAHEPLIYNNGNKAIHMAIYHENKDMFNMLMSHVNLFEQSYSGLTPLHMAVLFGDEDMIQRLVQACPIAAGFGDANGQTPLHYALIYRDANILARLLTPETVRYVNIADCTKKTIAHYAGTIRKRDFAFRQILLNAGADLNIADEMGHTAMEYFTN